MSVPRATSLGPGVAVNIVLKADQPTGKLTHGKVKDLLSRGDHPRGIKVRLQDGQIGRVQSLAGEISSDLPSSSQTGATITPRQYKIQEDARNYAQPPSQEASLEDYIKFKPMKKGKGKKSRVPESVEDNAPAEGMQEVLEKEFPSLDSSLVAAILHDSDDVDGARSILQTLI